MALYEDYLNQNNLYTRPSEMMSNVNDYLGANRASLPMKQDSLGSMMSSSKFSDDIGGNGSGIPKHIQDFKDRRDGNGDDGNGDEDDRKDPPPKTQGQGGDPMLSKFISDLGVLDENQQGLLLDFITGGGQHGDAAKGVSPEEYAQLFNVSTDYSDRFQGFPQLTDISQSISNVFNNRDEQRAFEQRAAQQAQIAQSNRTQGGLKRDLPWQRKLERKQTQDTLNQRQGAVDKAASSEYGTLLSHFKSALRSGWTATSAIHDENPKAVYGWNAGDDNDNDDDGNTNPNPPPDSAALYEGHVIIQNGIKWRWSGWAWEKIGPASD